jgi:hypothetical protein
MATYAGARPGSGANFKKLSGALAARGADNPDALAAWIGRRKYGHKGMAKLSAGGRGHSHGHGHANLLNFAGSEEGGYQHSHVMTHGHEYESLEHTHEGMGAGYCPDDQMRSGQGSASGVGDLEGGSAKLRTPQGGSQQSTGFQAQRLGVGSRTGDYGSMSNTSGRSIALAGRMPVVSPWDILVSRGNDGSAQVRHRRGGAVIGQIRKLGGGWAATPDGGGQLEQRTHQRAALLDLLGTWNRGMTTPERPAVPYAQPPQQTPLMAKFGIPAINALATPMTSADSGPRTTDSDSGSEDTSGLSPKGQAIYKKLRSRGFPAERALAFAKRAQNMGAKAAS